MVFDPAAYGSEVASILALDGNGARLMPLAFGSCSSEPARAALKGTDARRLFPSARAPEAAFAGLYLYFSCMDECHSIAQEISTPEGSFWHGILHRQEPDPGNASYWFRRVGPHPIYPDVRDAAAAAGVNFGPRWDPLRFIDYCGEARRNPGSPEERAALVTQRAEWQLLFHYCASRL